VLTGHRKPEAVEALAALEIKYDQELFTEDEKKQSDSAQLCNLHGLNESRSIYRFFVHDKD
jgi:hypothetical protein